MRSISTEAGGERAGRPARRSARGALVVLAALLLPACSALSLAWNYLDRVLVERVDDWVDLRAQQRERLQRDIEPWLQRVATERVPVYAGFLRELAARNERGLGVDDAQWAYERVRDYYRDLIDDATGWVAPPLAALEPDQIDHLEARMRDENAEYRGRYLDVTTRNSHRALGDRIIEAVERWTGTLDLDQRELIQHGVRELPDTSQAWYAYRLRMQAGLLALVRSGADAAAIRDHLRAWWVERAGLPEAERAAFREFERELVHLLAELAGTLSPLQEAALGRRLRDIAEGLDAVEQDARVAAGRD